MPLAEVESIIVGLLVGALVLAVPLIILVRKVRDQAEATRHALSLTNQIAEGENAITRLQNVQDVTAELSEALTPSQAADAILSKGLVSFGAVAGFIVLVTEDNESLVMLRANGYPEATIAPWQRFSIDSPVAIAQAARTGEPVWLSSATTARTQFPDMSVGTVGKAWIAVPLVVHHVTIGAMGFSFSEVRELSATDKTFIMGLAQKCAQALERTRLYEAERTARLSAEAAQARATFLAEVSRVLASSLNYDTRLQHLAWLLVPEFADWCFIDVIEKDQNVLRRIEKAVDNPAKDSVRKALHDRFRPDLLDSPKVGAAYVTGQAEFYPQMTDDLLTTMARNTDHHQLLRAIGIRSAIFVPLLGRGQILGMVTLLYAESGRQYTQEDVATATDLASRAGLLMDNVKLYTTAREQNGQLQTTLASIGDGVIATDSTGQITFINLVAQALTAWTREKAIGQPLENVFRIINEDSREPVPSPLIEVLNKKATTEIGSRVLLISRTGRELPIEDSAAPIRDDEGNVEGAILVFRDIAERRMREETLQETLRLTQDLYETCHKIGLVYNPDDVLHALLTSMYLKHAAQAGIILFDTPWKQSLPDNYEIRAVLNADDPLPGITDFQNIADSPLFGLFSPVQPLFIEDVVTHEALNEAMRAVLLDSGMHSALIYPLTLGERCFGLLMLYFAVPNHWTDQNYQHLQIFVEQVCVAMDNIRLYEAEARARLDAERADQIKLKFLAMISHELRTPLTSIKGFATTLMADDIEWDAASQREFIGIINDESDKLSDLIEQLLDLSRLQAGQLRIQPEPHQFSEILYIAQAQLEGLTANHHLVVSLPAELPTVMADMQRIAQVLVNLVGNATKFAPPHTAITITVSPTDAGIQVSVRDEGPGISPENHEKVFEAFQQLSNSASQNMKGAGLGLAICKGIIEAQGGRIWVEDQETTGATITFTLIAPPAMLPSP